MTISPNGDTATMATEGDLTHHDHGDQIDLQPMTTMIPMPTRTITVAICRPVATHRPCEKPHRNRSLRNGGKPRFHDLPQGVAGNIPF